jgi:hypothetical protein
MSAYTDISVALKEALGELLGRYDESVSEHSAFPDLVARKAVHFGDPSYTLPGRVELVIMNMDPKQHRGFDRLRFLSVRVMKSRDGGFVSMSCLHGDKSALRQQLQELHKDPAYLVDRVDELASGLPEESNPDIWR